jgi:Ca-activated chloride channel family protein
MAADLGVRSRLDQATRVIRETVEFLSGNPVDIGLRVYGVMPRARSDCRDSTLLQPVQPVDRDSLSSALLGLLPSGRSPIAWSLEQSAGDFPPEGENVVVLITGAPDDCDADPCAASAAAMRDGPVWRTHVIGLDVPLEERGRLACIGDLHPAASAVELKAALREVFRQVLHGPEGAVDVFEAGSGRWIASGAIDETLEVLPGRYDIRVRAGTESWLWKDVQVEGRVEGRAGARAPRSR